MTDQELSATINALRNIAPKLNEQTDRAAETARAVETFLSDELSIGLPAEVVFREEDLQESSEDDDAPTVMHEYHSLAYDRHARSLRLLVRIERIIEGVDDRGFGENRSEIVSETPWPECARDVKLASFAALPGLLREIEKTATRAIEQTETTATTVAEIMSALRKNKDRTPRELSIRHSDFDIAWSYDPFDVECFAFLDLESGDIVFVYEDDKEAASIGDDPAENARNRELVSSNPTQFVPIEATDDPGCLFNFINSNWTDDKALRDKATDCYRRNNGQYRAWKDNAPSEAVEAFHTFDEKRKERAKEDFLAEHGIKPVWT
jgi:hypothetical protein